MPGRRTNTRAHAKTSSPENLRRSSNMRFPDTISFKYPVGMLAEVAEAAGLDGVSADEWLLRAAAPARDWKRVGRRVRGG